jgi:hypothetical protein
MRAAHLVLRRAHVAARHQHDHAARITPITEINAQYAAFLADFTLVQQAYIESLTSSSTNTITVTATLTAPYTAGSVLMQMDNASVFGPNGTFTTPLNATATFGGITVGTFVLTGRQGNTLTIDPTKSSLVNLNPGVVLSASVQNTSQSSAAAIFPGFIVNRAQQMAISLVNYFNSFPIKLPAFNAPPHTPTQRGAIQSYVYQQVAGSSSTSLQQSLLGITLPTTAGPDLTIYDAAVAAAVEQSRQQVLGGVSQVFAGRLLISAPAPANRLGLPLNTSSGSSTTGSSTSATGSTTTGP